MKPNNKLIKLLNYRINQEEYSSRLYYAMSVWLDNYGYTNAASLWKTYSEEELVHAAKVTDFLKSFGIMPEIQKIDDVNTSAFKDLPTIIKLSFEHEYEISRQCEELACMGKDENNLMVFDLGMWLVREQIEELGKVTTLMDKVNLFYDGTKASMALLEEKIN